MSSAKQYVPSFVIRVGGQELRHGQTIDVLSVSVTDTVNQPDSFTFTVRDRHPQPARFAGGAELKWIDSGLFDEGKPVEIQMGYVDNLKVKFKGEITAVAASFPEGGVPTLTARGFSLFHRLQRKRRSKAFREVTDSDIATQIARAAGLQATVDRTDVKYALVPAEDTTFAALLMQRAQRINYEVTVKGRTLYFQKPRYLVDSSPDLTLTWGRDLRSFSPSLSTYDMVTEVKVQASQTARGGSKKALVGQATAGQEQVKMGDKTGPQIARQAFGDNPILSSDHNLTTQKECNDIALAQLEAKALGFISGRGSCIGNPELQARMVIELQDLGDRFSGMYYVTSVTHTIDAGGYRTEFDVKRNGR